MKLQSAILTALTVVAAGALAAQNTPIARNAEGYWERSNGNAFTIRQGTWVRVVANGDLVIRGGDGNQVKFQFLQRVRAPSHDIAARAMGAVVVSGASVGDAMQLTIVPQSALAVRTSIEVTVPRGVPALVIENRSGAVEVYDVNGDVQAATGGGPVRADRLQGNLVARTGFGEIRIGVVGGTVRCTSGGGTVSVERSGGEANCHTLGGDVQIGQTGGPVEATTEGGNVRVERAAGDVRARSVAGVIEVVQARGTVYADTRSGSIQVGAASGGVKAESGAGMVRVRGVSGPMTLSTMMGNILAELMAGAQLRNSTLAAGSGDITVMIPAEFGLNVRARNESGITPRIVSDFPEIQVKSIGLRSPVTGQGAINGGGPVLDLNTTGGVIYLRRVK